MRSRIEAFTGLLELPSRGFGGDGVIFAQKFGGRHDEGVGDGVDDGQ